MPPTLIPVAPPRVGRAIEEPLLAGMDLGVGETMPRGIPPAGEWDRFPAPEEAGDGARRFDVGGFKRDVGVGCRRPDLSRRLESLVCDFSLGCGLRILESWAGTALGGASPLDWAARLGRLLLVTEEGGWTPPPRRRPDAAVVEPPWPPRMAAAEVEEDWRSERLPPSGESGGVPECAESESLPD